MIDKFRKILFFTFIFVTLVLASSICVSLFLTPDVIAAEAKSAEYDGYIVKLKDDASANVSLMSLNTAEIGDGYYVVDSIDDAEKLADQSDIEFIEPNYIVKLFAYPDDTYYSQYQSTYMNLIGASSAWSKGYDGEDVTVAVIDSGIVNGHEDINYGNVLTGTCYTYEYINRHWTVVETTGSSATADVTGHGSFVSGIIAAQINNFKGIAGITDEVNILPLKCFASEETTEAQILAAIQDAITAGVDVINMSFGSEYYSQAEEDILQTAANAGIILVAAAGNDGDDIDKYGVYNYPAAYDCVISVGSVDPSGNISYFSQVNDSVWVAAPGEDILSIWYDPTYIYMQGDGTSFSAPFVSALAAIAKQYDKNIKVDEMKVLLEYSAVDKGTAGKDNYYGYGIINVADFIYALEHKQSYNIIYQLDGGSLASGYVSSFKIWDTPVTLPEPTKPDWNFGGWYTDAGFTGSIVTAIPQGTSDDYTVYARWYDDEQTTVSGITVKGYTATLKSETNDTYEVEIPEGTTISAADIIVTTAYTANISMVTTSDFGVTWNFTVTSEATPLNHKHYTINTIINHRPTAVSATKTGSATPASYDNESTAVPYPDNVSSWFSDQEGDALTFALVSDTAEGSVSLNDGTLEYTPSVDDAGKDITIVIKANDGMSDSASNVTVTVSVSDIPGSDNMLSTTTATFDKLTSSSNYSDISLEMALGNTLSSIKNSGTALDAGKDYTVTESTNVTVSKEYLASLANGNYILIFTFDNGYNASMAVTVTDSTVSVTNITLAYSKVAPGGQLTLSGTIAPTNASNKTIVWSLKDSGTTGASVEGSNFSATANGTAIVTATIANGISAGTDYVKEFTITVSSVAVTNITIAKSSVTAGSKLTLSGTVAPANATYTTIVWSLKSADTTGATLVGNTLSTTTAGTATVTATVADGVSVGTDYVKDFTITVSSGGGGGGGGGSMEVVEDNDYVKLICGNQAFEIPYTIEDDQAIVDIDDDTLDELIDSANGSGEISIDFTAVDIEAVTLPYDAFADITKAGIGGLTLRLPSAKIDISAEAMEKIVEQAKGKDITVSAEQIDKSALTNTQRQVVGDNPVYGLSVKCGSTSVTEFNGNVTISLPYELKSGQDAGGVVIWYLDSTGKLTEVPCTYDKTTKTVTFTVTHFSYYVISYDESKITKNMFSDVDKDAWYYDAVMFCTKNGITNGTGDGKFSPDALLTRGQFLVMLMRAYGLEATENTGNNFADAGNTYYTGYLAAAKSLGIASGVGDNMFAPDSQITRQDMCVLLYRVLNILNKLPETSSGTSLTAYSDCDRIAGYAQDAMGAFVADGVISGSNGQLNPEGISTRAQMAQVLYNVLYVQ